MYLLAVLMYIYPDCTWNMDMVDFVCVFANVSEYVRPGSDNNVIIRQG